MISRFPDNFSHPNLRSFAKDGPKDFMREPFGEKKIHTLIRNLIPPYYENDAFICGGFACHLMGLTLSFTDIDVFAINTEVYNDIINYWVELTREVPHRDYSSVTQEVENGQNLGLASMDINSLTHFTPVNGETKPVKCQLIDASRRVYTREKVDKTDILIYDDAARIEDILKSFDISWCMVGISFKMDEFVYHGLADEPEIVLNRDNIRTTTPGRVEKYLVRKKDAIVENARTAVNQILTSRLPDVDLGAVYEQTISR